ncbi:MAG TPA: hypothetical protein VL326_12890 [Kofleriaceae bacterium]|nr:hypothetical protein [Kofleriaceae bacterium]
MRRAPSCTTAVLVAVLGTLTSLASGCTLYWGGETADDYYYPPDAGPQYYPDAYPYPYPDAAGGSISFARCEDGTIRHISMSSLPPGDMPGHGAGTVAGTCANGCRSAIARCATAYDCAQADQRVCNAPIATGPTSSFQGQACSSSSNVTYTNTNACGQVYPGGTCMCDSSGKYACSSSTDTASIHASLVGKWHGTVTPPSFATPYQITLWIYPDGTYWSDCAGANCTAFYYGGDGPHPWRKINVLSQTTQLGATANIGMFYDTNIGALTSLFVDATTLRFTFYAAWFGCSQPFDVSLTRN